MLLIKLASGSLSAIDFWALPSRVISFTTLSSYDIFIPS